MTIHTLINLIFPLLARKSIYFFQHCLVCQDDFGTALPFLAEFDLFLPEKMLHLSERGFTVHHFLSTWS